MSVYSVPVTIGVDEEQIARKIESNVENRVIENVTEQVKKLMFRKSNYYRDEYDDPAPLREMVKTEVKNIVEDHQDEIIRLAAVALADKLYRTKAVKEAVIKQGCTKE